MYLNFTIKSSFFNEIDYWMWGGFRIQFRHGGQSNTEKIVTSICKGNTITAQQSNPLDKPSTEGESDTSDTGDTGDTDTVRYQRRPSFNAECRTEKRCVRWLEQRARRAVLTVWREQRRAYRDLLKLKLESFWEAKAEVERSSPRQL